MKRFSSARHRWYALGVLWSIVIVLGIGGFLQQAADEGIDRTGFDTLYLTLQLVTLDYDPSTAANWRLEIARFVAPLMAASTILQTASVVFREQFERFRLRFARGHTIVAGLGDTGSRLAVALARAGHRVVAIERDRAAVGIAAAQENDVTVLIGDAAVEEVLTAARLDRAARLVVTAGTDATNVGIVAAARRLPRPAAGGALRASVHLTDAELCGLLRAGDLDARDGARVGFFNLHEAAARSWIATHPAFGDGTRPAHPVVLGLGQLGRSLVVALAQRWVDAGDGAPLHLTLVDRAASGRWEALRLLHPALDHACAPTLLDLDLEEPTAAAADAFTTVLSTGRPTWVAVAFEDESLALSSGLLVHQTVHDRTVPVVVRARTDAGLGGLLTAGPADRPAFPGMALFAVLDRTCTPEAIDGGVREQLARAVHDDYIAHAGLGDGLRRAWDELDDGQRDLSRRRVDGMLADLDALDCDLLPLRRWGAPVTTFTEDEVERIAEREHERWAADRRADGWSHGPVRDDTAKQNPLLVDWADLPPEPRLMNLEAAGALPVMLARAGFEPVRR